MIYVVMSIAYYVVLTLGLLGVLAFAVAAAYGLLLLVMFVFERYLIAKEIRDLFRDFMITQMKAERKARK